MVAIRVSALSLCLLLVPECGRAQGPESEEYLIRNAEMMVDSVTKLRGRVSQIDKKLEYVAASGVSREDVDKIIGLLEGRLDDVDNQQQYVMDFIIEFACRTQRDNCELKRRIAALESKMDAIENGPEPTPAPPLRLINNEQPVDPPEGREPNKDVPAPPVASPPRVPAYAPTQEIVYHWDGSIDFITDRRNTFCANARLIARCIDYPFADGTIYHGDIYAGCDGRVVLLRHNPTSVHRVSYR